MAESELIAGSTVGDDAYNVVLDYHERTKHRQERYAAGPETLDWSAQPDPFRDYNGAPRIALPLAADNLDTAFGRLYQAGDVPPHGASLASIALLFELSFALSAWKEYGPDRWALRCNPSSGNLHPTEAYLLCTGVAGLEDGIYHYLAREHALERRARVVGTPAQRPRILCGLSSIHWREAWKYGERAFRYSLLDTGHALGALRYAAAALGWRAVPRSDIDATKLGALLGTDRRADYFDAEEEDAELLVELLFDPAATTRAALDFALTDWRGIANRLDPHPMYRWPVIDAVSAATVPAQHPAPTSCTDTLPALTLPIRHGEARAADIIRGRRSAQRFDREAVQSTQSFWRMLDALLPRDTVPWDGWQDAVRIHPVLFVHRVEGLVPGLYALPRGTTALGALREAMRAEFEWQRPPGCPSHLPLYRLIEGHAAKLARALFCHQAIGADAMFGVAMLAEFDSAVRDTPWRYRTLFHEAGLLGQVLYLEAEAAGLRGTGIGCFFDDDTHELLGLSDRRFQSIYHFTVGAPLTDTRIQSLPPYAERGSTRTEHVAAANTTGSKPA